jgi:hypothetical protein
LFDIRDRSGDMAAGSLAAALPDFMVLADISGLGAFKIMFYAYAGRGLVSVALYKRLPHAVSRRFGNRNTRGTAGATGVVVALEPVSKMAAKHSFEPIRCFV